MLGDKVKMQKLLKRKIQLALFLQADNRYTAKHVIQYWIKSQKDVDKEIAELKQRESVCEF